MDNFNTECREIKHITQCLLKKSKMPKSDGLNPREKDDLEKIDSGKAKITKYRNVNEYLKYLDEVSTE